MKVPSVDRGRGATRNILRIITEKIKELGVQSYLVKPIRRKNFLEAIQQFFSLKIKLSKI